MRLFFRWRPSFRFPMRFMYSGYSSIMQWRQSFESVMENSEIRKDHDYLNHTNLIILKLELR